MSETPAADHQQGEKAEQGEQLDPATQAALDAEQTRSQLVALQAQAEYLGRRVFELTVENQRLRAAAHPTD